MLSSNSLNASRNHCSDDYDENHYGSFSHISQDLLTNTNGLGACRFDLLNLFLLSYSYLFTFTTVTHLDTCIACHYTIDRAFARN